MSTEAEILNSSKTIAVVGLSPKPDRPSYRVASYLKEQGYRIIPANTYASEILGETCYPDLRSIPEQVDVVDIFRRSEGVPAIVEEAIEKEAKAVWMQEGVINEEAAARAREAGLLVVMDRCMLKEHWKLEAGEIKGDSLIRRQNPARLSNGRQYPSFDFELLVFHDIGIKKERVLLKRGFKF